MMRSVRLAVFIGSVLLTPLALADWDVASVAPNPATQAQGTPGDTAQRAYQVVVRHRDALVGESNLALVPGQMFKVGDVRTQDYVRSCTTQLMPPDAGIPTLNAPKPTAVETPLYANGTLTTGTYATVTLASGGELNVEMVHSTLDAIRAAQMGICQIEMPVVSLTQQGARVPELAPGEKKTLDFPERDAAGIAQPGYTITVTRWNGTAVNNRPVFPIVPADKDATATLMP
jgi:hypothetical protein